MKSVHLTSPRDPITRSLEVRVAHTQLEINQLREVLDREHYLKAGRPAGHVLWPGVYRTDSEDGVARLCAVFCWGGAAWRLKERDPLLGWDPLTRANRLGLVVQLRRFLLLEAARAPNLATRCLGLARRRLPGQGEETHGFPAPAGRKLQRPPPARGNPLPGQQLGAAGLHRGFQTPPRRLLHG